MALLADSIGFGQPTGDFVVHFIGAFESKSVEMLQTAACSPGIATSIREMRESSRLQITDNDKNSDNARARSDN